MTAKTETVKKNGQGTKKDAKSSTSTTPPVIVDNKERRAKLKNSEKEESKPATPENVEETKPVVKELSLEEKIAKVESLAVLIDKREKLQESRRKLNAFVIGSHQFSENIVLTDSEGNTFKTSNTEVFGSVVNVIRETLDSKIRDLETKINF